MPQIPRKFRRARRKVRPPSSSELRKDKQGGPSAAVPPNSCGTCERLVPFLRLRFRMAPDLV
jgi:hypothetical protein